MTPLRFYAARTLRNEPMLRSLSVPLSELVAQLGGKRVALVCYSHGLASYLERITATVELKRTGETWKVASYQYRSVGE